MEGFHGYYYDPNQDNYFKIPNYWDASFLSNSSNLRNSAHFQECTLSNLKTALNKRQPRNIVQDIENIALSKRCIKSDLFMKMRFKLLQHRQHLSFNYPVIRPTVVETDCASVLHMISDRSLFCELRRYEVKWTQSANSWEKSEFKIIDTTYRSQNFDYLDCLDATLDHSSNDIACLSPRRLTFIRYDNNMSDYQLVRSIELAWKYRDSAFPRGALRSYASSMDSFSKREEDSVIMFYNHRTISSFGSQIAPLLTISELQTMPRVSLSKYLSHATFTAVGSASYFENMRKLDAYVSVGKAFSLLSFTSARRERELISFGDADGAEIVHLQCLLSSNDKRSGVIVGRADGSVELWDDRQPKSAAVTYRETKGAVKGGTPPRPVVDCPSHSFVATAIEKYGAIGIWQLQTGELTSSTNNPRPWSTGTVRDGDADNGSSQGP
ncbi:hypothetical protein TcWFU_006793 [Taenia crassiceps]|uniref:Uncharacterized protein n=1 Tax=Taenia crassiceps TaxID=6207 RepID=A0ABR4QHN3_9CEST